MDSHVIELIRREETQLHQMLAHLAEQPAAVPEMAFIFIVSGRDNITYSDYHVYIPNTYLLGSGRRPQRLPSS